MTIVVDTSVALRWCFQLNKSDRAEELWRSGHHLIDLVIAEITNAAWKFAIFDRMAPNPPYLPYARSWCGSGKR
jgi:predicted nucleic acid-binding protein